MTISVCPLLRNRVIVSCSSEVQLRGLIGRRLVTGTNVVNRLSNRLGEVSSLQAITRLVRGNWYNLVFNLDDHVGRTLGDLTWNGNVRVSNLVTSVFQLLDSARFVEVHLSPGLLGPTGPAVVS